MFWSRRNKESAPPQPSELAKTILCHGIPIRGTPYVRLQSLSRASGYIDRMVRDAPMIVENLIHHGAEFHVFTRAERVTDLPQYSYLRGRTQDRPDELLRDTARFANYGDWDKMRGLGGLHSCCGEECLIDDVDEYYKHSNTCVHEFSHTIMDYGLDDGLRGEIANRHDKALCGDLWHGNYASVNPQEYWATLSEWYFGGKGDQRGDRPEGSGGAALINYDYDGFTLLDDIYAGRKPPARAAVEGNDEAASLHTDDLVEAAQPPVRR